jgi:peptidoglycan L-alanyl-D-glutamate endopeptidase CwlK
MSLRWSYNSLIKLEQLDHRLRIVTEKVRDLRDITIITGHRGKEEQNKMVELGRSQVYWPNSKHNTFPSLAVDIQPYPYVEKTLREDLSYIAGLFIAFGRSEGLVLRWGGDWNKDGQTSDNKFDDLFHIEISGEKTNG